MLDKLKNLEWWKVLVGAGIAAAGAALAVLTEWSAGQDFGVLAPFVAAVLAVLVNLVRKYSTAPTDEQLRHADAATRVPPRTSTPFRGFDPSADAPGHREPDAGGPPVPPYGP